jgi:hypothetical protein
MGSNICDNVTPAPDWLIERMEKLKKLPPPTLEEVEMQFRAVERMRLEYEQEEKKKGTNSTS